LEQCKTTALENNLRAKNSRLSTQAAEQVKKEAFTKYFPGINATGLYFRTDKPILEASLLGLVQISMLETGLIGAVTVMQPVFAGGQIYYGNKLAQTGVEAGLLQEKMTDDEILLQTEQYFWQVVSLAENMKTIAESDTMLQNIYKDVQIAVKAGVVNKSELLKVELEQNKLQSLKVKVQNGEKQVKLLLGHTIGVPPDSFDIDRTLPEEVANPANIRAIHEDALLQRAEYQLLNKDIDASRLKMKMKQGELLPNVAIGGAYNSFSLDKGKTFATDNQFGIAMVTVSVPITDWWGGSYSVKKQKIEMTVAQNKLQENSDLLLIQMQQLWNELEEAYQQVELAAKAIEVAKENLRLSADYYHAGTAILSDLLDAQILLRQNYDQRTDALTAYHIKLSRYKQAIGNNY
jgi:outer membrane protein TolC